MTGFVSVVIQADKHGRWLLVVCQITRGFNLNIRNNAVKTK